MRLRFRSRTTNRQRCVVVAGRGIRTAKCDVIKSFRPNVAFVAYQSRFMCSGAFATISSIGIVCRTCYAAQDMMLPLSSKPNDYHQFKQIALTAPNDNDGIFLRLCHSF